MLVANSFDLWQRDVFFSAAEEVQQSADILESAYRTWLRQKKEELACSDLEELRREMQTALGTAKWQLEEFERAVRLSYGSCQNQNENRMARHQQFVVAIESKISGIEDALRTSSLNEDGKLRWVKLDEDERDDLAMFLSGTTTKSLKHPCSSEKRNNNLFQKKNSGATCCYSSNMEANSIQTTLGNDVAINIKCKAEETSWLTPKSPTLKIGLPVPDRHHLPTTVEEDTPKGKGKALRSCLHFRGINYINKLFRCSTNLSNRMQSPRRLRLRYIFILMLSFFLLVPYFIQLS